MSDRRSKLVYTTDPEEAKRLRETGRMPTAVDAPAASQTIRVAIDKKRRRGKTVTVASGFEHTSETLKRLARTLKKKCGAGGSFEGSEIEIQGEHVERVAEHLKSLGYQVRTGR